MNSDAANRKRRNQSLLLLSSGLSIGTGLGISLGVAFDSIPLGLSLGAGAGLTIGIALSNYYQSKSCVQEEASRSQQNPDDEK